MSIAIASPEASRLAQSFLARYQGRTVVAIGAHPDDIELGIGGTLARLTQAGTRVIMAVASVPSDFHQRRREAQRAAEILGCELRILLDRGPQRIEDIKHYELVGLLDALIREYRPAALFTHSASELHRDHVTIHNACLATQRLQFFDFFNFHPTMCRPMPVPFHPRGYVDISDTIEAKMQAIASHESQFALRGLDVSIYRETARFMGRLIGVKYAEGLDVGRILLS